LFKDSLEVGLVSNVVTFAKANKLRSTLFEIKDMLGVVTTVLIM